MIETNRLLIRKFTLQDWLDLYQYLSLPEIYEFEPGNPINEDDAKKLVIDRSEGNDFYAVELKESNKMIGHLYFYQTEPKDYMTWELGYIFNPKYQNTGYCTESAKAIVEYAFSDLGAHKVVAFCNPLNIASWKVLEKIGMMREGHFKEKAFFRRDSNNKPIWHDCYAYGILSI